MYQTTFLIFGRIVLASLTKLGTDVPAKNGPAGKAGTGHPLVNLVSSSGVLLGGPGAREVPGQH